MHGEQLMYWVSIVPLTRSFLWYILQLSNRKRFRVCVGWYKHERVRRIRRSYRTPRVLNKKSGTKFYSWISVNLETGPALSRTTFTRTIVFHLNYWVQIMNVCLLLLLFDNLIVVLLTTSIGQKKQKKHVGYLLGYSKVRTWLVERNRSKRTGKFTWYINDKTQTLPE